MSDNHLEKAFIHYQNDGFWRGFLTGVLLTSAVCGLRCLVKYGNR